MKAVVTSGEGSCAPYFREREETFRALLGYTPYPGTLNLSLSREELRAVRRGFPPAGGSRKRRAWRPALLNGLPCHIRILPDHAEVAAPVSLRERFGLRDGDVVTLEKPGNRSKLNEVGLSASREGYHPPKDSKREGAKPER